MSRLLAASRKRHDIYLSRYQYRYRTHSARSLAAVTVGDSAAIFHFRAHQVCIIFLKHTRLLYYKYEIWGPLAH